MCMKHYINILKTKSSFFNTFFSNDNRSTVVKKNIVASLLIKICSIVISLLIVPITLGYISTELYGIWLTLSSIIVWFHFFDIGFTLGLKNRLAEAIAVSDWKRSKSLISTTYFMMIAIFLPLCILLEFIVPCVNWAKLLNISEIYNTDIIRVMYALCIFLCIQMVVNVIVSVVAAFQKVALSQAFSVVGQLLSLVAIFLCREYMEPSLLTLAFVLSALPIIVMIVATIYLFSTKYKNIAPSFRAINTSHIKDIFGLGIKFFLIQIQVVILFQTTNFLISNISGPNDVTSYNIAYKYLSVAMMVFNIALTPLWPAFTDAKVKQDYTWMKNVYQKFKKLYMVLLIGIILMALIAPFVYKLWIGEMAIIPYNMTALVAIYIVIYSWDSLQVTLLNGIGTIKLQTYITLIGMIIHIPLSFLFGKYIGALGVVVSMILINLLYSTIFTIQVRKILNQRAEGIWIK